MFDTLGSVNNEVLDKIKEEMKIRKTNEVFLLFSMGSQFDHLIKQSLDKLGVFCLVADPALVTAKDVSMVNTKGIIISGGPASVHAEPPKFDSKIFDLGIPVLGICLGFQMWANYIGLKVKKAEKSEYGIHDLTILNESSDLFRGMPLSSKVLESHGDMIKASNKRFKVLASTENAPIAAGQFNHLWGVQFHPEVSHTVYGQTILKNFCFRICKAKNLFPAEEVAQQKIEWLKKEIGNKKILLALSGGSDSSVVAYLLKMSLGKKIKKQVQAIYIRGVDRPEDEKFVIQYFGKWLNLKIVDATKDFLKAFTGITTMKEKRIAMRGVYKRILEQEAKKYGASLIAQGTLYTDVSESGGGYNSGARKAQIKLHHNVNLGFSIPELTPLIDCVKDTARNIGRAVKTPEELLIRYPFPGPGLAVRIIGEVNKETLSVARRVDTIFIDELRKHNLYNGIWQAGAVVTPITTTCAKGDDATSGIIVLLWAVWSVNGFTADAAELDYEFLKIVDRRITNEIREVGAVFYRISGKPPSTIEAG
jgi:GMP synthase (glutamine-hydrolysing)